VGTRVVGPRRGDKRGVVGGGGAVVMVGVSE